MIAPTFAMLTTRGKKTADKQPKIEKAAVINILKDRQPRKAKSVITAESANQKNSPSTPLASLAHRRRFITCAAQAQRWRKGGARLVQQ